MQRRYLATSDVVGLERGNTLFENLARHRARERERESRRISGGIAYDNGTSNTGKCYSLSYFRRRPCYTIRVGGKEMREAFPFRLDEEESLDRKRKIRYRNSSPLSPFTRRATSEISSRI